MPSYTWPDCPRRIKLYDCLTICPSAQHDITLVSSNTAVRTSDIIKFIEGVYSLVRWLKSYFLLHLACILWHTFALEAVALSCYCFI